MTDLRFGGRVVVVTGAGRGVGRSHALLLAAKGARVVVADCGVGVDGAGSSTGPAAVAVDAIRRTGGEAVPWCASVAEERGARSIVDTAIEAFGRLDVVVNNAGIHDLGAFDALTVSQFRAMLEVHYFGPAAAFLAHEACPLNGEVLQIGMASVARIAVVRTRGISKSPLTPEDIAPNLNEIMDVRDALVTETAAIAQ